MRKHLSKWHRRFGISAALIAIYLSITGLMLNHSHDLNLDSSHADSSWLLKLYGVQPPQGISSYTDNHKVDKLGESLFIDFRLLGQYNSDLVGAVALEELIIIALNDSILLLTLDGEVIETLSSSNGLPGRIYSVGSDEARLVIKAGQNMYKSDTELLNWLPANSLTTSVTWSTIEAMHAETESRLKLLIPAYGPSWERLLQDLHSGRFFKMPGTLLIDLTGIFLLLLSLSGIISFTLRNKGSFRH